MAKSRIGGSEREVDCFETHTKTDSQPAFSGPRTKLYCAAANRTGKQKTENLVYAHRAD